MFNFRGTYKKNLSENSHAQSIMAGGRSSELLNACENNRTDTILILLSKEGVNANETDSKNNTPLIWASIHDNTEIMKKLLKDYDVNVNNSNKMRETALHFAAKNGNLEMIKLFVEKGANYNAKTLNGKLSSNYAEDAKQFESMAHLIKLEKSIDV